MKKAIFALFCICVITFSCKKSDPDPVAPTNQPYANSNVGTNWVYEVKTVDPTTMDTTTNYDTSRVISGDTTIGSRKYYKVEHNDGSHSYYNLSGNDYYQFQHIAIGATLDTSIEALYLKDNASVGTNWPQTLTIDPGIGFPVTVTFTSTIAETGLTKTVYGTTYNDVISVTTTINAPGITINTNIKNYYARNIGLIQADYKIDIPSLTTTIENHTLLKFSEIH